MADQARDLIREAIKGKPDAEVMTLVEGLGGVEAALDMVFQGMEQALDPGKAQDCVIAWDVTGEGRTYEFGVTVADKKATAAQGKPADPRVTMACSFVDFIRLIAGELDGMTAFMSGKLKITGDIMFAQQIPQMFGIA